MEIVFENISMTFTDQLPILQNISFTIPRGTRLALIGQSGAGKSTIASLVRRDRNPSSGRIMIDNHNLQELNLSSVLRHMGNILQRPEVISGNVRENIIHGVPFDQTVTDDDIWKVIDLVSPEMRTRFNGHGLDTRVGKQGLQLSGGEQQRLCVMRALIKDPQFLIVDEATSSLDSETELVVQKGINTALKRGISALVIAHRFSTLRECNKFVVLKKIGDCGKNESQIEAEADNMQTLWEVSPIFRRLAEAQNFRP